ncbi:2-succinyl-5-enolpyruvyl-6-hydroxy-3-cyclohexene-1-carboxylate synthase, partial [candidate division KSB1 bacterium]|nr:2-succinyl-5-enolpyruvyl-6-hydroxy-3-cyclohexene-1-carboxylate synthase [candidate division KSB1 bacterium]
IEPFLDALNWPVYADITSGHRLGGQKWPVLDERVLYSKRFADELQFGTVLHIGAAFTAKLLQQWLEIKQPRRYLHVCDDPRRIDPGHLVTNRFVTDTGHFCSELAAAVGDRQPSRQTERLAQLAHGIRHAVEGELSTGSLSEPAVALLVSRCIPGRHGLFLGNSMPVRDMNAFAAADGPAVPCAANRGASGIDGAIATAVGYASGLGRPVTLITGDVAALHDLNSLNLVRNSTAPVVVIIINNDGGGIFSFLPIARQAEELFEKYFQTPHGLTFERAAAMFGLPYAQPRSNAEFRDMYREACLRQQSTLIEVRTNAKENAQLHQTVEEKIRLFIESSR